jgi:arylsulfatase A-like enzyme
MVVRWPGHIKPGTVKNQLFAALDWLPTLVDIGGGAKGDALKTQIEARASPDAWATPWRIWQPRGAHKGFEEAGDRVLMNSAHEAVDGG